MSRPTPFDALCPDRSAVVEACAGSGKTWMLVSRILRLLLAGVPPADILAITFTRLAAREMEERLTDWLRHLALAPDEEVLAFLQARGLGRLEAENLLPRARGLYETYLCASPSVTLCTFDVWFLRLLRHAPLSGVLRRDSVPGKDAAKVRQQAWQALLQDASSPRAGVFGASLEWLFRNEGLYNTRNWVTAFADWRAEWWAYTEGQADPPAAAAHALAEALGVGETDDVRESLRSDALCSSALEQLAQAMAHGTPTVKAQGQALREALQAEDPVGALSALLWTDKGDVRKRIRDAAHAAGPAIAQAHALLLEKVGGAEGRLRDQASLRLNTHLFRVGQAYLERLMELKRQRGEAGFQDVQWAVCGMLESSEQSEYLQYRLDARYRHLLLDEFQDTSPLQWRTLGVWLRAAREAGEGPTVFLVGDPRQSIYRFRRADARLFEQAAAFLETEWGAVRVTLDESRRSGPAVVGLVNRVFAAQPGFRPMRPQAAWEAPDAVLLLESEASPQRAVAAAAGGLRDPLRAPRSEPELSRERDEARAFARCVKTWTSAEGAPELGGQRLSCEDILVLAQRRSLLVPFEQALREARIPFLSQQRGGLLGTLEVADLRELLRFLVNPRDNLALAQVLRAPPFGASDADLLALAGTPSWWGLLLEAPPTPLLARAARHLALWMSWSARLPVHDLLDRIMGEMDWVNRYRASVPQALQASVAANLQAFLELALNLDGGRYPSLPRFLQELEDLDQEGDEAPDEGGLGVAGNAVRLMTIHAAKGLESPVVWLVEPTDLGRRNASGQWFVDWPPGSAQPSHFSLVPSKKQRGPGRDVLLEQEQRLLERERDNLLYVALTRARQLLVVSGRVGDEGSEWFRAVREAAGPEVTVRRAAVPPCSTASEPTASY
ncbi:MAG: UvrD-helicase domain-containing protein [Betaproteobacteria bacterium]|nr:UvrD-helicase domain-containing protein [Betaproteobacteria bacterium]